MFDHWYEIWCSLWWSVHHLMIQTGNTGSGARYTGTNQYCPMSALRELSMQTWIIYAIVSNDRIWPFIFSQQYIPCELFIKQHKQIIQLLSERYLRHVFPLSVDNERLLVKGRIFRVPRLRTELEPHSLFLWKVVNVFNFWGLFKTVINAKLFWKAQDWGDFDLLWQYFNAK